MKRSLMSFGLLVALLLVISGCQQTEQDNQVNLYDIETICNPLNISYRYRPETDQVSRREAADPTVINWAGMYYLFASKSGGYWGSGDLTDWIFCPTDGFPTEEYAPCAAVINGDVYFLASNREVNRVYKTKNPYHNEWELVNQDLGLGVWDPALFQDDDGRVYLYWGCSNNEPIYGIELDPEKNLEPVGDPVALFEMNPDEYGWEVPGDYNTIYENAPWIEGPWVNKQDGVYYLQYAGPGTEYKSYNDAVYVSENPLGPYRLAEHNPFAYKPEGFAAGAGHGSLFQDEAGNYWHIGTITISQRHIFERRLGIWPAFIDDDGLLYTATQFGDYPMVIPNYRKIEKFEDIFPEWMLLSYGKKVTVSSAVDTLPAANMVDEDIRSLWAARSGNADEWAVIDLGQTCDVYSVQINFGDYLTEIYDRQPELKYQYVVEASIDGEAWEMLIDQSENEKDRSHDYVQLRKKKPARYLKLKDIHVPGGHIALSGFRVFGKGSGEKPPVVEGLSVSRDLQNKRSVKLCWEESEGAMGYQVRYGFKKNKLYHSYMVYENTEVTINSLNVNQGYWFSVQSFNENGISDLSKCVPAPK